MREVLFWGSGFYSTQSVAMVMKDYCGVRENQGKEKEYEKFLHRDGQLRIILKK